MTRFKEKYSFEQRQGEAIRIMKKYPDRIPVIVEKSEDSDILDIDKKKFLVPKDLTMGQFTYVIRKRIKLAPETAIFLFINNTLPASTSLISQVYKQHANKDLFLTVTYAGEQTFGMDSDSLQPSDIKKIPCFHETAYNGVCPLLHDDYHNRYCYHFAEITSDGTVKRDTSGHPMCQYYLTQCDLKLNPEHRSIFAHYH